MTQQSTAAPRRDPKTGTWSFVVDLPPDPDGKRRQARRRGFATRKAAQETLDKLRVSAREGAFVEITNVRLGAYFDGWLEGLVVAGRAPATIASYQWLIRTYVVPVIGGMRLQALQPGHLDALYAKLTADGLSARTTRYVHSVVRKALADAVRKGLVIRNVATLADPPSAKAARAPEMQFWTPTELSTFFTAVADDEFFAVYRVAAMTGLRRGDVCGLRWSDVDLDGARVQVRRQLNMAERWWPPSGRRATTVVVPSISTPAPSPSFGDIAPPNSSGAWPWVVDGATATTSCFAGRLVNR